MANAVDLSGRAGRGNQNVAMVPLHKMPPSQFLDLSGITGSTVNIFLRSSPGKRYTISKSFLCAKSAFFSACFEGHFREAMEQCIYLDEEVKVEPFEMLLQFMVTGDVHFKDLPPAGDTLLRAALWDKLTQTIELELLAHFFLLGSTPASKLEPLIRISFCNSSLYATDQEPEQYPLKFSHLENTWKLPRHNPLRRLLADVTLQQYLMRDYNARLGGMKFLYDDEMEALPGFALDILEAREGCGPFPNEALPKKKYMLGPILRNKWIYSNGRGVFFCNE